MQIATNHFGHFILTAELLPLIAKAEAPRIVNVASSAQKFAPKAEKFLADINANKKYSPWPQYGVTKLCNMLFTYELVLRLKSKYPKIIVGGGRSPPPQCPPKNSIPSRVQCAVLARLQCRQCCPSLALTRVRILAVHVPLSPSLYLDVSKPYVPAHLSMQLQPIPDTQTQISKTRTTLAS
jgi:hypothetical protein